MCGDNMQQTEVSCVTCEELQQLINKGEDAVIVDIRSNGSYETGHIKGAINIYYDSAGSPFDREIMLSALPSDKPLIIYCD
jgi:rhodanese-related sulfurtransferase